MAQDMKCITCGKNGHL
jgi:5'-3' exoribonuclease 2